MPKSWGLGVERIYFLNKMTLRELVGAFFTHYSIQTYLVVIVLAGLVSYRLAEEWQGPVLAAAVTVMLYPLVEYLVHRFVLHSHFLFKSPLTAKVWKRIHYDHHQNPHDLSVLFGALYTTLPTIAVITLPLGWLIAGPAGAAAALAGGCAIFTVYEFFHCVEHLPFTPQWGWLRELKRRHLAHHFHNEHGNYGIITGMCDRLFGTIYERPRDVPRSPTVYNLGYTGDARHVYPWVAELSESDEAYAMQRKRRPA